MIRLKGLTTIVTLMCLFLLLVSVYELHWMNSEHMKFHHDTSVAVESELKFAAYGKNVDSGFLKHVFKIFDYFGYKRTNLNDNWDVLWSHSYPFSDQSLKLKSISENQKVNHIPGSGYITNKMDLATSNIVYVPKAFKIPQQKENLLLYIEKYPKKMFVQKSNDHRGIKIQKVKDLDLNQNEIFVQEYIDNPLLIDGYKFDIGVYTIITSIDPLTVYIYNGDILFRYCSEKYYPFDPENLNKYVIGDDYLPTWEVPALKKYYNNFGSSMRESFNAYMRQLGRNPQKIWEQIEEAIKVVCLEKERAVENILSTYSSKRSFFEMIRIDFVVDDDLNVYLMEANMSPNLSSAHFPPNRLLYEQVLFNLFSLVGLGFHSSSKQYNENEIEVSEKNLMVYVEECFKDSCASCMAPECQLCKNCITKASIRTLAFAYKQHNRRQDCRRIFPPTMRQDKANATVIPTDLSPENQLLFRWFRQKCLSDQSWC